MPPQSRSTRQCRQGRPCSSSAWHMGHPRSPTSGAAWVAASPGGSPPGMRYCALSPQPLRTQAATAAGSPTRWAQRRPLPRCMSKVSGPVSGWAEGGQISFRPLSGLFVNPGTRSQKPHTWGTEASLYYPTWNAFLSPLLRGPRPAGLLQEDPHPSAALALIAASLPWQ